MRSGALPLMAWRILSRSALPQTQVQAEGIDPHFGSSGARDLFGAVLAPCERLLPRGPSRERARAARSKVQRSSDLQTH